MSLLNVPSFSTPSPLFDLDPKPSHESSPNRFSFNPTSTNTSRLKQRGTFIFNIPFEIYIPLLSFSLSSPLQPLQPDPNPPTRVVHLLLYRDRDQRRPSRTVSGRTSKLPSLVFICKDALVLELAASHIGSWSEGINVNYEEG